MDVRKTGVPQLTAQQPQQGVGVRSWVASVRPPPLALPRNLGTAVPQSQRGKTMIIAKDLATWILPAEPHEQRPHVKDGRPPTAPDGLLMIRPTGPGD